MLNPKSHRNGQIENQRKGSRSLGEKSSSSHALQTMSASQIRRPKTVPDLLSYRNHAGSSPEGLPRQPTKLLMKATMLGSLGPVQLLMRPESTVGDLVATAVRQYVKEGRRPILPSNDPSNFNLHYSQFSLESLDKEEKLIELGSRTFFLCPRKPTTAVDGVINGNRDGAVTPPFSSCSKEADKAREGGGGGFAWLKFMNFSL